MTKSKTYPPTPPVSTRAEVERICAENALHADAPDRFAALLDRLVDEVDRLADKLPEVVAWCPTSAPLRQI
jgi:hypothetical protein